MINGKTLPQLGWDDLDVWAAESEENAKWYAEFLAKPVLKKVYGKKTIKQERINSKTGEKEIVEKEVTDKNNYTEVEAEPSLMAVKTALAKAFPELGYEVKGESKKKKPQSRAEKAALILAKFKK